MTNGAGSQEKTFVFLSIIPLETMANIPKKYAKGATQALPPKIAPAISAINGSFAPQGMNVVVIIVILLSFSFSIVREAIIPGTPQPVPIKIGMNDFPDRPNLRNILSITKAILAIYPQSSRMARNKKRTNICGTKPSTAPTPATIPSRIRPMSHSLHPIFSNPLSCCFINTLRD